MRNLIYKYSDANLTSRKDVFFIVQKYYWPTNQRSCCNPVFLKFKKMHNKINPLNLTFNNQRAGLSRQKVLGIKSLAKQTLNKS